MQADQAHVCAQLESVVQPPARQPAREHVEVAGLRDYTRLREITRDQVLVLGLFFSFAMPMLYLVIAIYGWIAQWIDRLLLLRLLLPPPPTHEQLMVYIVRVILPLAVVGEPPPPPPRSRPPRGDARLPESRPLRLRPHLLPRSLRRRDARPQLLRGPGPGGEIPRDSARFGEIRRDSARLREIPRDSAR